MSEERYDPTTIVPASTEDALARWDAGLPVFTVEMGGLGPGYEQAIQTAVLYTVRRYLAMAEPPPDDADAIGAAVRGFVDEAARELHLSGAQHGAAVSLAWGYITKGWKETLDSVDRDRITQVSKTWPQEPEPPVSANGYPAMPIEERRISSEAVPS